MSAVNAGNIVLNATINASGGVAGANQFNNATHSASQAAARTERDIRNMNQAFIIALGPMSGIASRLQAFSTLGSSTAFAFAGITAAVIGLGTAFATGTRKLGEYEQQLDSMRALVKLTGADGIVSAESLDVFAKSLAATSGVTSTEIRTAQIALLSYQGLNTRLYNDITKLSVAAKKMKGGELSEWAQRFGEAIERPADNLADLNEEFNLFNETELEAIKLLVRSGSLFEAQNQVVARATEKFGGLESSSNGLNVKLGQLSESWDGLLKSIGDTSVAIQGIEKLTESFNYLATAIKLATEDTDESNAKLAKMGEDAAFTSLDGFLKFTAVAKDSAVSFADGVLETIISTFKENAPTEEELLDFLNTNRITSILKQRQTDEFGSPTSREVGDWQFYSDAVIEAATVVDVYLDKIERLNSKPIKTEDDAITLDTLLVMYDVAVEKLTELKEAREDAWAKTPLGLYQGNQALEEQLSLIEKIITQVEDNKDKEFDDWGKQLDAMTDARFKEAKTAKEIEVKRLEAQRKQAIELKNAQDQLKQISDQYLTADKNAESYENTVKSLAGLRQKLESGGDTAGVSEVDRLKEVLKYLDPTKTAISNYRKELASLLNKDQELATQFSGDIELTNKIAIAIGDTEIAFAQLGKGIDEVAQLMINNGIITKEEMELYKEEGTLIKNLATQYQLYAQEKKAAQAGREKFLGDRKDRGITMGSGGLDSVTAGKAFAAMGAQTNQAAELGSSLKIIGQGYDEATIKAMQFEGAMVTVAASIGSVMDTLTAQYAQQTQNLRDQYAQHEALMQNALLLKTDEGNAVAESEKKKMDSLKQRIKDSEKQERKLFEMKKMADMASVITSTASGAMMAYAQLGPIGGSIAAGAIIAAGAVQLQAIRATTFSGGGSVSSASAGSAPSLSMGASEGTISQSSAPTITQNLNIVIDSGGQSGGQLNKATINQIQSATYSGMLKASSNK